MSIRKAIAFIKKIGIPVRRGDLCPRHDFQMQIWIEKGELIVGHHAHAGDLLHEAGHLALLPSSFRIHVCGDIEDSIGPLAETYMKENPDALERTPEDPVARALLQSGDSEAIAWSYSAAVAAGIDPYLVCENGFMPEDGTTSEEIAEAIERSLRIGEYVGIHGLRAAGFLKHVRDWPKLLKWVQP